MAKYHTCLLSEYVKSPTYNININSTKVINTTYTHLQAVNG